MKLSIVGTLYCSEIYLAEFHRRVSGVAKKLVSEDYEIIYVNDGSPDNSLNIAIQLFEQDTHVVVLDLSRNFGHHKAMLAGIAKAKGDRVLLMDTDLEEDPEYLLSFNDQLERQCCDVVYGVQETRKGSWFERFSGSVAYYMMDFLSDINHPKNIVTMRLMKRPYVDALLLFHEYEFIISYIWVITGFNQQPHFIKKHKRPGTTYTFRKKVDHFINAITSFSAAPLRLIFYTGFVIFIIALLYAIFLAYQKLALNIPLDGWTSLIISIWLLSGLIIFFIGIIGIYIMKIFMETKRRPISIVRKTYER
ncbi:glycosyltransferase family 2 protein [Polynucleobacter sp. IMCC 29146]|uniref:glycosyltransferase family 2 protein n=1 Tax=Polynucleobacter sp. IMCC 29146 TaxID=2780953 RepID=UPI001F399BA2|nr:glycosyltransferase family 2 protein [Polynucleobacter sp. IMCC 29146]MCE7530648.1 glycosyltransferase family 2 protein [Polynucleobacter sp. IMCC 29146]